MLGISRLNQDITASAVWHSYKIGLLDSEIPHIFLAQIRTRATMACRGSFLGGILESIADGPPFDRLARRGQGTFREPNSRFLVICKGCNKGVRRLTRRGYKSATR